MKSHKPLHALLALFAMTVLLFNQSWVSGYRCVMGTAAAEAIIEQAMQMPCKMHCEQDSQVTAAPISFQAPVFSLLGWVSGETLLDLSTRQQSIDHFYFALKEQQQAPPVPLPIQYQVFHI